MEDGQPAGQGVDAGLEPLVVGRVVALQGDVGLFGHGPVAGEVERPADAFGKFRPDVPADQRGGGTAEEGCRFLVDVRVVPGAVEGHQAVGHAFEQVLQLKLHRGMREIGSPRGVMHGGSHLLYLIEIQHQANDGKNAPPVVASLLNQRRKFERPGGYVSRVREKYHFILNTLSKICAAGGRAAKKDQDSRD
jgi:hypothetical protein